MNRYLLALLDLIFPPTCLICGGGFDPFAPEDMANENEPHRSLWNNIRHLRSLCSSCFSRIAFFDLSVCRVCGYPFSSDLPEGYRCSQCIITPPPFEGARSVGYYRSALFDSIKRLKYHGETALAKPLGRLMALHGKREIHRWQVDLTIPVPLHRERLRRRGYNQAHLLGREVAKFLEIPLCYRSLKRRKPTRPQVGLTRDARERNVKGAFWVTDPGAVCGRRILIVDDVYTTGATLRESAKCLLEKGAEAVFALTLARVP